MWLTAGCDMKNGMLSVIFFFFSESYSEFYAIPKY